MGLLCSHTAPLGRDGDGEIADLPAACSRRYKASSDSIGESAQGTVLLGTCRTSNASVALKLRSGSLSDTRLENERFFLTRLEKGDHIIKLLDAFEDISSCCLVLEYCDGGDLLALLNKEERLQGPVAQQYARDMLTAVAYCHSKNIAHRDIKPENLLIHRGIESGGPELRLADFETATSSKTLGGVLTSNVGTVGYGSPQMIQQAYTEACDDWSCGVVCYGMLCGSLPFEGASDDIIRKRILEGRYTLSGPSWQAVDNEAKELVAGLLTYSEQDRVTAKAALGSAWLR